MLSRVCRAGGGSKDHFIKRRERTLYYVSQASSTGLELVQ